MSLSQIWDYPPAASTDADPLRSDEYSQRLVEFLRLLGDETRWRIVRLLAAEHRLNVTQLCQRLQHSQPAVSHHLMLLRNAGLLAMERNGKHNYYSLVRQSCADLAQELGQWFHGRSGT